MSSLPHKTIHRARYERFRRMLVEAREAKSLTQLQLAVILKRPQSFVSKYETGERRIDVEEFLQISEALSISPQAFLTRLQAKTDED